MIGNRMRRRKASDAVSCFGEGSPWSYSEYLTNRQRAQPAVEICAMSGGRIRPQCEFGFETGCSYKPEPDELFDRFWTLTNKRPGIKRKRQGILT